MIVFERFGQNVVEKLRIGLGDELGIHGPIARRLLRRFGFPGEDEGSSLVIGILWLELRQRAGELRHPDDPGFGGRDANRRELLGGIVPLPEFDLVVVIGHEDGRAAFVRRQCAMQISRSAAESVAATSGCGLRHFELPQQVGDIGAKDGVVRVEHRQQHAVDERMHGDDARGQCGAAIAIGFPGECFERCGRGFGAGGGQVVLRERGAISGDGSESCSMSVAMRCGLFVDGARRRPCRHRRTRRLPGPAPWNETA